MEACKLGTDVRPGDFRRFVTAGNLIRDTAAEGQILADGSSHLTDLAVSRYDDIEITWSGEDGTVTGTFTVDFTSGGAVYSLAELGFQWQ